MFPRRKPAAILTSRRRKETGPRSIHFFFGVLEHPLSSKEGKIIGLTILLANIFAALGGCWWPIEVVPAAVRQAGVVSPAWWAMGALHKLRFFQGDFAAILPHLGVLLGLSAVLSLLAGRYFKIRD